MLRLILCALACAFWMQGATARECATNINGRPAKLTYSDLEYFKQKTTLRDLAASRLEGLCPGFVIVRQLTPGMSDSQRAQFCLNHDAKLGGYRGVSEGPRDAYGVCTAPGKVCEFVKEQKETAIALTGLAAGATAGASTAATAAGVTAVVHSSGAVILTGSAGYIAGTLGTLGATALSVLTAPVVAAGAAVSVMVVGSAIYICR